ncbi:hypothetical protein GW17_00014021, partial [Ensete ventricosum]
ARTTRGRRQRVGEEDAGIGGMYALLFSSSPLLLLLPFFSLNRPLTIDFSLNRMPTTEIDRRRSILVVPPGSERSAYRSAIGLQAVQSEMAILGAKTLHERSNHTW